MRRRDLVSTLVALFSGPGIALANRTTGDETAQAVSMIRLIAVPNGFDGRRLHLVGYLGHSGPDRGIGLYVSECDGRNGNTLNSVDVQVEKSTVRMGIGRYVILDATFHAPKGKGTEFWNGYLDRISGLRVFPPPD